MDQFKYIQTDERKRYSTKIRPSRIVAQVTPEFIDYVNKGDSFTKVYTVNTIEDFNTLTSKLKEDFKDGDVCYFMGKKDSDKMIYVWSQNEEQWISFSISGEVNLHEYRKASALINLEKEVSGVLSNKHIEELGNIGSISVDESNIINNAIPVYNERNKRYELIKYNDINDNDKVKMSIKDGEGYLDEKIDGKTIISSNNKLVSRSLEGLVASIEELNHLKGTSINIQDQINIISNEKKRDFKKQPLELDKEVTGKLQLENIDADIVLSKDINKLVLKNISDRDGILRYNGKEIGENFKYSDKEIKYEIKKILEDLSQKRKTSEKITIADLNENIKARLERVSTLESELKDKKNTTDKIELREIPEEIISRLEKIEESGFKVIEDDFYITNKHGFEVKVSDIFHGYNDIKELKSKNPAIEGKIYITKDNNLYLYDGEKYVQTKTKDVIKTIFFVFNGEISTGLQDTILQLPHTGSILECKAFCNTAGESLTEISIEKTKEFDFPSDKEWLNVFNSNLLIQKNDRIQDGSYKINPEVTINKNDYFRVNILKASKEIKNITIQISFNID